MLCLELRGATMAGGITTSMLQRHSLFLISTSSSSSSISLGSASQSVPLCARHAWVCRPQCVVQRLAARSWTSAVAAVAGEREGGEELGLEEEDEEGRGLALYEEELGLEEEEEEEDEGAVVREKEQIVASRGAEVKRTFRLLGNKEKKELRAYAHQLGDDICMHQVGKWGLTTNCVIAISDALEANELVKIRVLDNLDEEFSDTSSQLEAKTGAQIVGKIGRTLLLYRPSMRKLKAAQAAEEKAYKYQKRKNLLASRTKSSRSFPGVSRGKR